MGDKIEFDKNKNEISVVTKAKEVGNTKTYITAIKKIPKKYKKVRKFTLD